MQSSFAVVDDNAGGCSGIFLLPPNGHRFGWSTISQPSVVYDDSLAASWNTSVSTTSSHPALPQLASPPNVPSVSATNVKFETGESAPEARSYASTTVHVCCGAHAGAAHSQCALQLVVDAPAGRGSHVTVGSHAPALAPAARARRRTARSGRRGIEVTSRRGRFFARIFSESRERARSV